MILLARRIGSSDHFEIAEQLNGSYYRLVLYTQVDPPGLGDFSESRVGRWVLDTYNSAGLLVAGIGVVASLDLYYSYRHLAVPPGALICDTSDGNDPDLSAFSTGRARMLYKPV